MHGDWHVGRPVVVDPPPVDYSSLPPYDGSVSYPTPPLHHSQWVDPRQDQQHGATQQGGSGSGSSSFSFGEFSEMMTSIFGLLSRVTTSQVVLFLVHYFRYWFAYVRGWEDG
ncbi:hypothetical protein Hanom_Chr09g00764361 [Helianthus anomalus]